MLGRFTREVLEKILIREKLRWLKYSGRRKAQVIRIKGYRRQSEEFLQKRELLLMFITDIFGCYLIINWTLWFQSLLNCRKSSVMNHRHSYFTLPTQNNSLMLSANSLLFFLRVSLSLRNRCLEAYVSG